MNAIDILVSEHNQIERLLDYLNIAVNALDQGQALHPDFFIQAAVFIQAYADGIHHRKEENIFFPIIAPGMQKAVDALLGEHELARGYTRGMAEAALAWQNGDQAAGTVTHHNAHCYAALLREHIAHENKLLFPAANWLLLPAEQNHLIEQFASLAGEDQAHTEKYLALLNELENNLKFRR